MRPAACMSGPDAAGSANRTGDGTFVRPSIWLCMSGGGFRASLFEYGCLKRLHELGLLGHVRAISATSGGAIVAALLATCRSGPYLDRDRGVSLETYDWERFEATFLALVRRGAFAPVYQLTLAYGGYGVALGCLVLGWFVANLQGVGLPGVLVAVLGWFRPILTGLALPALAFGVCCHAALLWTLLSEKAHESSNEADIWAEIDTRFRAAPWASRSGRRLLLMLLSPAYLRWQLLNLRAYKGALLAGLPTQPSLFLTAVDLNAGKEVVFSSGLYSDLTIANSRELWDQRVADDAHQAGSIEVAQAVCASSAIPPLFRPVAIGNARGLVGVFVDGGVLDNLALNVPKALSVAIHPRRSSRYGLAEGGVLASFKESISFVFLMDGGKLPQPRTRRRWGRLRAGWRILNVLVDHQSATSALAGVDMRWNVGIDTGGVGLEAGFPAGHLKADDLDSYLLNVRTHLDSFSLQECAALAWCGYAWTDQAIVERGSKFGAYAKASHPALKAFHEILPSWCGPWDSSVEGMRRHLRYSHRLFGLSRAIGRTWGFRRVE